MAKTNGKLGFELGSANGAQIVPVFINIKNSGEPPVRTITEQMPPQKAALFYKALIESYKFSDKIHELCKAYLNCEDDECDNDAYKFYMKHFGDHLNAVHDNIAKFMTNLLEDAALDAAS